MGPTPGVAKYADSPAALAAASDIVCLCVVGDDDVRGLAYGDEGLLAGLAPGGTIVIHSTIHPDTCRELADKAAAQGISVVDAPVSGGSPAVEAKQLLVMVGGEEADVAKCRPVFEAYGDPVVHLGPLGAGQVTKILNNLLFSANLGSAISLLELGESLGVSRSKMCEVVTRGSANSKARGGVPDSAQTGAANSGTASQGGKSSAEAGAESGSTPGGSGGAGTSPTASNRRSGSYGQ